MAGFACPDFNISDNSLIMPIPLHPKRLRERGFSQYIILAREISKRFHIPLDFIMLRRHVYTGASDLTGEEGARSECAWCFFCHRSF